MERLIIDLLLFSTLLTRGGIAIVVPGLFLMKGQAASTQNLLQSKKCY
jgi:hypothetical protein